MAITNSAGLNAMLKTYYKKNGLQNTLLRADPFLKQIKFERVEGKQQNFAALFSTGGACSANFLVSKRNAAETAQAKEFQVTPGQLFSSCTFTPKEVLASKTLGGAYVKVAGTKMFASGVSFRNTLALALYGTGHGEIFVTTKQITLAQGDKNEIELPNYAIAPLDINSTVEFKSSKSATANLAEVKVVKIGKGKITVSADAAATIPSGSVICLSGCTDSDGNPLLPVGLAAWLPTDDISTNDSFFGVNRSVARERLAGVYVAGKSSEKKYEVIENAILALRRMGSLCDKIVMNDEDFLALSREIEAKTTFQKVNGGSAKQTAEIGNQGFGFSVSTNWLENVIDSPFVPKGRAYVLSSDTIELWGYTNNDKVINDGAVVGNEPGKANVDDSNDPSERAYQLLIDDMITMSPGTDTRDGPAALATMQLYGSFVVTNPSVNGVVTFAA
ncbi:MAG: hypothetical protein K6B43_07700 [Treponema sp.]|nr:hypothetical protein [Treponema sp.]